MQISYHINEMNIKLYNKLDGEGDLHNALLWK